MAPAKCGTRHLSELWIPKIYNHTDELPVVDYIIIRPPLELLISALSTDAYRYNNEKDGKLDFTVLLNGFINNSKRNVHWDSNLFNVIYYYCKKNPKTKIIELNNLSNLLTEIGKSRVFESKKYEFPYHHMLNKEMNTKDKMFEYVKEHHPNEVDKLMVIINEQNKIYNKLWTNNY